MFCHKTTPNTVHVPSQVPISTPAHSQYGLPVNQNLSLGSKDDIKPLFSHFLPQTTKAFPQFPKTDVGHSTRRVLGEGRYFLNSIAIASMIAKSIKETLMLSRTQHVLM